MMRNLGGIALLVGIVGFFYASSQLAEAPPPNADASITEALRDSSGRWELARYGAAAVAGFGLLMLVFPKGR
jgi:hypothetical protein